MVLGISQVQQSVLPTGAATSAKQPALGTAGAPAADVLSIQGIAGAVAVPVSIATAVPVTGPVTDTQLRASAVPVTGPVTDTQLRASAVPVSAAALPLPAGAATEATVATRVADATVTARLGTLGQKTMANSTPVAIASDQTAVPISGTVAVSGTVPVSAAALPLPSGAATSAKQPALGTAGAASTDVLSIQGIAGAVAIPVSAAALPLPAGAATAANQTTLGSSTTKINDGTNSIAIKAASTAVVAADPSVAVGLSPNSPLPAGTNVLGALTANQSVNHTQVAGTAIATAAAGTQKVGIVGNAGAIFDGATAAAVPANAVLVGLRAATANPANATGGNLVAPMGDKAGRTVTAPVQVRELVAVQQTAVAATTETTVVTAGAAGVFNDIIGIVITTAGAAAQTITIKDATAGTTRLVLNYPNAALAPGAPLQLMFPAPLPQAAAAANWTVTQSLATACNYTFLFAKNT